MARKAAIRRRPILFVTLVVCSVICLEQFYNYKTLEGRRGVTVDRPKVVLFAYFRTGSTLAAEMFNLNPAAFYWYEPTAAVTSEWGWERNHRNYYRFDNGTEKPLTDEIRHRLLQPFKDMFVCNFTAIDRRVFSHRFMWENRMLSVSSSLQPFKQCMRGDTQRYNVSRLQTCLPVVTDICRRSRLVAVKVIRLRMDLVEELLLSDPDVRIIHLVRDPRGMLNSWWGLDPELVNDHDTLLDAHFMYRRLRSDCDVRKELERKYPGRLMMIRYEDLVARPDVVIRNVYNDLLGLPFPDGLVDGVEQLMNAPSEDGTWGSRRKNASLTANGWRTKMDRRLVDLVEIIWSSLITELGYPLSDGL